MSRVPIRSAMLATLTAAGMVAVSTPAPAQHQPGTGEFAIEPNVDRMGGDYTSFTLVPGMLTSDSYIQCQSHCERDQRCKAFTYVRPNTIQGPHGRCWLKSSVPAARPSNCCVSGLKIVRAPASFPPGCAITRFGVLQPRASLRVSNRGKHIVWVSLNNDTRSAIVAAGQTREFKHVLQVGRSWVIFRFREAGRWHSKKEIVDVANQGPQTCGVVKDVSIAP